MKKLVFILGFISIAASAQDFLGEPERDRDPASIAPITVKRVYPGSQDEEALTVQSALPEARNTADTRGMQREIFKSLYNQELKEERHDEVEE